MSSNTTRTTGRYVPPQHKQRAAEHQQRGSSFSDWRQSALDSRNERRVPWHESDQSESGRYGTTRTAQRTEYDSNRRSASSHDHNWRQPDRSASAADGLRRDFSSDRKHLPNREFERPSSDRSEPRNDSRGDSSFGARSYSSHGYSQHAQGSPLSSYQRPRQPYYAAEHPDSRHGRGQLPPDRQAQRRRTDVNEAPDGREQRPRPRQHSSSDQDCL